MKLDFAKKAIVALLFILIALLVAILILMSKSEPSATPSDTDTDTMPAVTTDAVDTSSDTSEAVTTAPDVEGTTDAAPITEPPVTDPVTTAPPATEPPVTDPVTTEPPVTEPPVGPEAPEGFSLTKTYESESGTKLNIRAVCTAVRGENGSVSLTVDVYLLHYSLGMGPRNGCLLTVGENTVKFSTERIKQEENKKTSTLLFSHTEAVAYGDIADIYVKMPIRVTYGSGENAKYIEYLEIDTALLIA